MKKTITPALLILFSFQSFAHKEWVHQYKVQQQKEIEELKKQVAATSTVKSILNFFP
ncbi:MAG: hypothetical protein RJA07_2856 [Bacteroidota bacterium]|jgi:uncharacterized GH25 family protein